jgi:hypothetical protein
MGPTASLNEMVMIVPAPNQESKPNCSDRGTSRCSSKYKLQHWEWKSYGTWRRGSASAVVLTHRVAVRWVHESVRTQRRFLFTFRCFTTLLPALYTIQAFPYSLTMDQRIFLLTCRRVVMREQNNNLVTSFHFLQNPKKWTFNSSPTDKSHSTQKYWSSNCIISRGNASWKKSILKNHVITVIHRTRH